VIAILGRLFHEASQAEVDAPLESAALAVALEAVFLEDGANVTFERELMQFRMAQRGREERSAKQELAGAQVHQIEALGLILGHDPEGRNSLDGLKGWRNLALAMKILEMEAMASARDQSTGVDGQVFPSVIQWSHIAW
jgi:hypothetical protein